MHHSFAGLDYIDERILASKVGAGFIDNKPIFYNNYIKSELNQTDIFIIVENTELFSFTYFDIVIQDHFADRWRLICMRFDMLHP